MRQNLPNGFVVATAGILKNNRLLSQALGVPVSAYDKRAQLTPPAVLAWGQRPSAQKAVSLAKKLNVPLWRAEDGFLRSLDSGTSSRYAASFVIDDLGIYFDVRKPSRLEQLIASRVAQWSAHQQARAQQLIERLTTLEISKYNPVSPPVALDARILVVDQVAGDASIAGAGASEQDFYRMLLDACQAVNGNLQSVCIKAHPAAKVGFLVDEKHQLQQAAVDYLHKHGIDAHQLADIQILSQASNPIALLKQVESVYTVSSHLGFEALLLNKAVHSFAPSWYAGFGLTLDRFCDAQRALFDEVCARRTHLGLMQASIEQLFYASYIDYSFYVEPSTAQACQIEEVIEYLQRNRQWQQRLVGDLLAYDFSHWKVGFVRGFLGFAQTNLQFKAKTKMRLLFSERLNQRRAERDDKLALAPLTGALAQRYVVWGRTAKRQLADKIFTYQNEKSPCIYCMEDGFIRSNGLGATLLEPLSVVMDKSGVYYDATQPSDLEILLSQIQLNEAQKARATKLQQLLLTHKVSKYNVGGSNDALSRDILQLKAASPTRQVHLVVGQVEDDASVQNCTSVIRSNAQLLQVVRAQHPNAIIIYKPHPDIEAGLRVGKVDDETLKLADGVAYQTAMPDCLALSDVVHTISSLTGFEALLRGLSVVCYGLPFYAGFGLTQDIIEPDNLPKQQALARRQRNEPLSLQALIYATLVAYPLYRLPHGYGLATPEAVIAYLYQQNHQPPTLKKKLTQTIKMHFMRLRKVYLQR